MKTFYVLRCFYGESRQSGEDLRVDLRTLAARATAAAALFLLLVVVLAPHTSHAKRTSDSAATPAPAPAVDSPGTEGSAKEISNEWKVEKAEVPTIGIPPDELDRKIGDVLKRPIYQWRMPQPRDAELDEEKGFFASFIDEVNSLIERAGRWFANRLEDFEEWLRNFFKRGGRDDSASSSGGPGPDVWVYILVFSLIALVVIAGFLIFKNWRAKKDAVLAAQAAGAPAAPDIHDENVLASQLPADEWLALARELVAKGEFRAALRALFLASLAMLAQQQLVAIARGKTNHDYLRELRRRSHALPAVPEIFRATVFDFDRVWYGRDAADAGLVTKSEERFGALRESVAGGGDAGAQAPVQKPEPHHA